MNVVEEGGSRWQSEERSSMGMLEAGSIPCYRSPPSIYAVTKGVNLWCIASELARGSTPRHQD
jgi:hypothetical protein